MLTNNHNHHQKKAPPFLMKTYKILENPIFAPIIRWNDQSNGFVISDSHQFATSILPQYFKHSNMHSYIRQLNMYGFSKKRNKNDSYYFHQFFKKDHPDLICQIVRKIENKPSKSQRGSSKLIDGQIHGKQGRNMDQECQLANEIDENENNRNRKKSSQLENLQKKAEKQQYKMFYEKILKVNQLLLIEQIANLQLILQEIKDQNLSQVFGNCMERYVGNMNAVLMKSLEGTKKQRKKKKQIKNTQQKIMTENKKQKQGEKDKQNANQKENVKTDDCIKLSTQRINQQYNQ